METVVYIKESDFSKYTKGKKVVDYPNPYIKDVNGRRVHIVAKDLKCISKILSPEEKEWLCLRKDDSSRDIVQLECDWFPKELVVGTSSVLVCGKARQTYDIDNELSKHTGYVEGNGNLGSRSVLFDAKFVNNAISILRNNGYDFQHIK